MREQWMVYTKKADFAAIAEKFGISPVTARIMRNRDVEGEDAIHMFLHGKLEDCHDPELLKDMEKAADILLDKLLQEKPIRIIGDYDVDGVCATYILYKGLARLGAKVDYDIPHRIRDGYGINQELIVKAWEADIDTILTCDNGISASEQIVYARSLGMTVIVTDHHDVPFLETAEGRIEQIPPADAVINPKQSACKYPFKGLCGAAVAYKLIQYLFRRTRVDERELSPLLEAAALATVGDVMVLQGENRIIVREGLARMADSRITGLRQLMEVNGVNPGALSAYHLGFVIGPCLNAGGRLDTAKKALELFLSEDESAAGALALELKELNDTRKAMTLQGVARAEAIIEEEHMESDPVYVIYLPDCHESLAGIIAGRIREKYNHPVFILTDGERTVKGSGRSIEGYHMYDALVECQDLLAAFGGHPMAAGLSLPAENVDMFRNRLNGRSALTEADFIPKLWIDVPLPFSYVTEQLVEELKCLEPFGNGNSKPAFAQKGLQIRRLDTVGKTGQVVKMTLLDGDGRAIEAVMFNGGEELKAELQEKYSGRLDRASLNVIYSAGVNEYNGVRTLQMTINHWELVPNRRY
ncbi:MAG: single-stranded-DNA-specific exonuclease RecJ [Lachnospiraceae bacterium]|nr:single-stranded-DNA-specific exonuclease RecJ [Lachnospiraceae bacterium]